MSTTSYLSYAPSEARDERSGIWRRLYTAFGAAQQKKADEVALACLAQLSPDQLAELGHSPSEIRDIQAQAGRTPPYWV